MNRITGLFYGIQRVIELTVEDTQSIFRVTEMFGTAVDERLIGNVELDQLLIIWPAAAAYLCVIRSDTDLARYMPKIGE